MKDVVVSRQKCSLFYLKSERNPKFCHSELSDWENQSPREQEPRQIPGLRRLSKNTALTRIYLRIHC